MGFISSVQETRLMAIVEIFVLIFILAREALKAWCVIVESAFVQYQIFLGEFWAENLVRFSYPFSSLNDLVIKEVIAPQAESLALERGR